MAAAPAGPLLLPLYPDILRLLLATRRQVEVLLGVEGTLADAGARCAGLQLRQRACSGLDQGLSWTWAVHA